MSRSLRARALTLLLLWVAAYAILMALFLAFGEPLNRMPLAVRVLVVSAVLVVVMSQLVIPLVVRIVSRLLRGARQDSN